jgi:hypothetical protein
MDSKKINLEFLSSYNAIDPRSASLDPRSASLDPRSASLDPHKYAIYANVDNTRLTEYKKLLKPKHLKNVALTLLQCKYGTEGAFASLKAENLRKYIENNLSEKEEDQLFLNANIQDIKNATDLYNKVYNNTYIALSYYLSKEREKASQYMGPWYNYN